MRFFFYGTLIDASDTPMARWLRARLRAAEPASVPGRLVAIPTPRGWFPALLPPRPGERVRGVCCELTLARSELGRLDRYEGRDYRRAAARALLGSRLAVVQLYRWHGAPPPSAEPVAGGDFLRWLEARGARAYTSPLRTVPAANPVQSRPGE